MPSIDDLPPPVMSQPQGSIDDLPPPKLALDHSLPRESVLDAYQKGGVSGAWDAMKSNKAAYDQEDHPVVAGAPPLALPIGALGAFGKAAVALSEGQGLGYAAGRTALSAGQGAVMSAMDGKEGESWQDKIDRAKSGAKLSGGIQLAAESLPVVGKAVGYIAKKGGEALTGVAPDLIENFAKRTDQVNDLIKRSGGKITDMADQVRAELSGGIQKAKGALNGQISAALEGASPEVNISAKPMIEKLEAAKARLNPNYKSNAIADIDEMIQKIKDQAKDGMLDAKGLYETKQYLGENSKGAYNKGGQIFTRASEAARAAKDAGGEARSLVQDNIPEISKADAQLSRMHAIEGRLNKNLLAPGTPEGALLAAGSGANPRNAANLRALEDISGVPVTQRVKDLATAREFASPGLIPKDFTGKAAARLFLGAGIGGAVDSGDRTHGAIIGATLASPMALKGVINAANMARKVGSAAGIPQVAQMVRQNPFVAQTVAQLTASQIRHANTDNPMNGGPSSGDLPEPTKLMQNSGQSNRTPSGEDRWAQSGAANLKLQDADTQSLLNSPQGKRLLIQASDLKPGSKAMQNVQIQIQKLLKGAK